MNIGEKRQNVQNTHGIGRTVRGLAAAAVLLFACAARADEKESWTLTDGEALTEDVTVNGALVFEKGSHIFLNGHNLTVKGGIVATGTGTSANLVQNPSFETEPAISSSWNEKTTSKAWTYWSDSLMATGWTLAPASSEEVAKAGCAKKTSPWVNVNPPNGTYVCFLQRGGGIKQNLTVSESGFYNVSFSYATRPDSNHAGGIITLSIDGNACASGSVTTATADRNAKTASAVVWIDAGTPELWIYHSANPAVSLADQCVWIDNVSVKKTTTDPVIGDTAGHTAGEMRIETTDSNLFPNLPVSIYGDVKRTYVLTGAADWSSNGALSLAGNIELDLNGFSLAVDGFKGGTGAGALVFNGGTLRAAAAGTLVAAGDNLSVSTGSGDATIDTHGFDVTIAEDIAGTGAIVKTGAGTLTLGASQTGTGAIMVNEGAFALADGATVAARDIEVKSGAALKLAGGGTTVPAASLALASGVALDIAAFEPGVAPIAVSGSLAFPAEGTVALTHAGGAFGFGEYAIISKSGLTAADGDKFSFTVQDGYVAEWRMTGDDLTLAVMSPNLEVANIFGHDTMPLPRNATTTLTGAGGLKLGVFEIPEGATFVFDPIATPMRLDEAPVFANGAKIALSSAYAGMTLGRVVLMTYAGSATFAQANFDATGLGAAAVLSEETAPDGTSKQLVLTVGDYANAAKELRITCIGDGITEGATGDSQGDVPQYRTALAARLAAAGYKPKMLGIWRKNPLDAAGVAQSDDWIWHSGVAGDAIRTGGASESAAGGVRDNLHLYLDVAGNADVVALLVGTNDIGTFGDSAATVFANYKALVEQIAAQRPSAKIIGATILDRDDDGASRAKVAEFNALLAAAANGGGLPANFVLADLCAAVPLSGEGNFFSDKFNLNWKGCAAAASALAAKVAEALPLATFAGAGDATVTDEAQTALGAAETVPAAYREGMTHIFTIEGKATDAKLAGSDPYTAKPGAGAIALARSVAKAAYYIELVRKGTNRRRFVWVDFDGEDRTLDALDFPWNGSDIQLVVKKMHVYSNDPAIHNVAADDDTVAGIIEGTFHNYNAAAAAALSGAPGDIMGDGTSAIRGWNDTFLTSGDHGCFQAHRIFSQEGTDTHWNDAETLFVWNRWGRTGGQDMGIGPYACHATGSTTVNSMDYTSIVESAGDTGLKETLAAEAYQVRRVEIWAAPGTGRHGLWTGSAGDSKMSTPGNWEDERVPVAGDNLDLTAVAANSTIIADVEGNPKFGTVTFSNNITFSGDITATAYSSRTKISVAADSTVTLDGNITIDGDKIVKHIAKGGRFVVTGTITKTGSSGDNAPTSDYSEGYLVAKGLVHNGSDLTFRLARNAGTMSYWAIGSAGITGSKGYWLWNNNSGTKATIKADADFTIGDWISVGTSTAGGITIDTTGLTDPTANYTITAGNGSRGGFFGNNSTTEGRRVTVKGGGTLLCNYTPTTVNLNSSSYPACARAFYVEETATLALNAGKYPTTGTIYIGSNAKLAVPSSVTSTTGGPLNLSNGATLAFHITGATMPTLNLTKTLTTGGTVRVKVTAAKGIRLKKGQYKLTSGGKFAGKTLAVSPESDMRVSGVFVQDGEIYFYVNGGSCVYIR